MLNFKSKKCLCNVVDCGKCLTLGCTDDSCNIHRIVTKWRYRKRLLESLTNKNDIKTCEEEVKRLDELMVIKQ